MSDLSSSLGPGGERPHRSWLMEALVVLGILGFGYFAINLDEAARQTGPAAGIATDLARR
jgi:hypothetical protein